VRGCHSCNSCITPIVTLPRILLLFCDSYLQILACVC
jgi:hypothetical protein